MVVLNPSVAVSLSYPTTLRTISKPVIKFSYVGKKLMKLQPRSCEHVITAIMDTLGSFIANTKPFQALQKGQFSLWGAYIRWNRRTNLLRYPGLLHLHLLKAALVQGGVQLTRASGCYWAVRCEEHDEMITVRRRQGAYMVWK